MAVCGELSPNDKNGPCPSLGRPGPCRCVGSSRHDDAHMCRCGDEWPSNAQCDLMELVERATVVEVRPGDVLVFEIDHRLSDEELESFREGVRDGVSEDVRVMVVERGRFAGVIRHAAQPDQRGGRICGFLWRDEHNPTGSDHRCDEPIHTGLSGEHRCACRATRLVTLNDVPPGMAETTSFSDLGAERRTYLPTEEPR